MNSQSFATSKHPLLLSEILWALKDVMDLSSYLPTTASKRKLVYEELCEAMPGQESYIDSELAKNKSRAGSLGLEIPHTDKYFAIPSHVVIIREKCYYIQVLFQNDAESDCQFSSKLACRGAIPKYRAQKFTLRDFAKFSISEKIEYASSLSGLRSKNFNLYQVDFKRRHVTKFSKKRFMTMSGESFPFNFFLNETLELNETDSVLPIPQRYVALAI